MNSRTLSFLIVTLLLPASVSPHRLSISDFPDVANCNWQLYPQQSYIVLEERGGGDIFGAEFVVEGLPPNYFVLWAEPTAAVATALGDPFNGGVLVTLEECLSGGGVALFNVNIFTAFPGPFDMVPLTIKKSTSASNPNFDCPTVILCDDPAYTRACVPENGSTLSHQPLAVQPSPADGSDQITPGVATLRWEEVPGPYFCCGIGIGYRNVDFGTTNPPPLAHQVIQGESDSYDVNEFETFLEPNTTYYWRVRKTIDFGCATADGPVWSFTTGDMVSVEEIAWEGVKQMYR